MSKLLVQRIFLICNLGDCSNLILRTPDELTKQKTHFCRREHADLQRARGLVPRHLVVCSHEECSNFIVVRQLDLDRGKRVFCTQRHFSLWNIRQELSEESLDRKREGYLRRERNEDPYSSVCNCIVCGRDFPSKRSHTRVCPRPSCKKDYETKAARNYHLIKTFGLTFEDYERMLEDQGGGCRVCGSLDPKPARPGGLFHVDHCHKTGRVRSLLCSRCNLGLGSFLDDPALLRKAADYVEAFIVR